MERQIIMILFLLILISMCRASATRSEELILYCSHFILEKCDPYCISFLIGIDEADSMLKIYKISEVTDIIAVYSDQILNLATIHDAILANDGNLLILVETSENAVLGKKERITDTISL